MSKTFQMTVRLSRELQAALDARVADLRAVGAPIERARLAAGLLSRALEQPVDEETLDVTAAVAAALGTAARRLRERGALTTEAAASLSRALDGLAARLRGGRGDEEVRDDG